MVNATALVVYVDFIFFYFFFYHYHIEYPGIDIVSVSNIRLISHFVLQIKHHNTQISDQPTHNNGRVFLNQPSLSIHTNSLNRSQKLITFKFLSIPNA